MRALVFIVVMLAALSSARAEPLTVFAAASLKNAFDGIARAFEEATGTPVVFSYAGTSILARQIEQGAPADVFVSAHTVWMEYLAQRDLIESSSRGDFARNTLVLIAPSAHLNDRGLDVRSPQDWLQWLGTDGRIAVALVDAVPAGLYAREALQGLGVWEALEPHLAQTDNVRAALRLVALGEAPLGLVYASDAQAEPNVAVVVPIDGSLHAPIAYSAARVAGSRAQSAERFLAFLLQPQAQAIMQEQGFVIVQ